MKKNGTTDLEPEEKILVQTRPAWRSFLVFFLGLAICVIGPQVKENPPLSPTVGLVFGAVFLLIIIRRWSNLYTLTTRRLMVRGGIFAQDTSEIVLEDVTQVEAHQGLTLRLMKAGHIMVRSQVPHQETIIMYGLPDPFAFKARLEQLVSEIQPRRISETSPGRNQPPST